MRFENTCEISRRRRSLHQGTLCVEIPQIGNKLFSFSYCETMRKGENHEKAEIQKRRKMRKGKNLEDLKRFVRFLAAGAPPYKRETGVRVQV